MPTHTGQCHCGAVRFEADLELDSVVECNCSICRRAGWQLAMVPADAFTLRSGEDKLVDYQFGGKQMHHPFCGICGVRAFSSGGSPDGSGPAYAVNARCVDGFDPSKVEVSHYDGAAL